MPHDNTTTMITGGRGFIGVNLVDQLSPVGLVEILDNQKRCSPTGWQAQSVRLHQTDILQLGLAAKPFQGIGQIVHLAAYGSVVESIADPMANFAVNVQGTLNVLRAAVDGGVGRLVFASTGGALIGAGSGWAYLKWQSRGGLSRVIDDFVQRNPRFFRRFKR